MACHDHCASPTAQPVLNRRTEVAALASTAALTATQLSAPDARAEAGAPTASAEDLRFMRIALNEARRGDYPFGAVIVKEAKILSLGRNLGKSHDDPTAHGEMVAIRRCL